MKKIGIIGSGVVAKTLAKGLLQEGFSVIMGTRDLTKLDEFKSVNNVEVMSMTEAATNADIIILAVKGAVAIEALDVIGISNLTDKTVIDTCNPIANEAPVDGVLKYFTGPNESLMELLQNKAPKANFVKAFSCVGNAYMVHPNFEGQVPTMFYCGNNIQAKLEVKHLLEKLGWDTLDMGAAAGARAIEPLCMLWCIPGIREGKWNHAFKMLK